MREKIIKMTYQHRIAVQATAASGSGGILLPLSPEERPEFKENDNVSHFICRLAYCRNEELRKWFITQETRLFSIRLSEFKPAAIKQLLESKLGINYEELKPTDKAWIDF
jgi:DNA primase large subunit